MISFTGILDWMMVVTLIFTTSGSIVINRKVCSNDIKCGAAFHDVSGNLHKFVDFEVEYLLEGGGFDGAQWVPDDSFANGGYLLFVLLGPKGEEGLYKFWEQNHDIFVELIVLVPSSADVAWSPAIPNIAFISSLTTQSIVVVDLDKKRIIDTYNTFKGKQLSGPDGIYADDDGNVYFTDTDYNVNDAADPVDTISGGNLFRINALTGEVFLEGKVEYGYNGITLNNIYGNSRRLMASNTVDLPDDIYEITNNDVQDVDRIFVAEYRRQNDGSLKDRGRYYSITENMDKFPQKTFLDGMTFDAFDNLYLCAITNQTLSKISVLNFDDCSDSYHGITEYIGEIVFAEGHAVNAVTLAGDGYFYASLVDFPNFTEGTFVRFKAIEKDEDGTDGNTNKHTISRSFSGSWSSSD